MTRSQKSNRLIKNDSNIDADHNDRKKYQSKVKTKRHVDIDSVASISNNEINSEDEIEQSAIETSDESSVETDDQSEPVANQSDRKNEHKVSNRQKPEVASNKKYDS